MVSVIRTPSASFSTPLGADELVLLSSGKDGERHHTLTQLNFDHSLPSSLIVTLYLGVWGTPGKGRTPGKGWGETSLVA